MGWAIGYDEQRQRDIGYGVPAICDHPDCGCGIDRGLSFICGGMPSGGEVFGCGLFFCENHRTYCDDSASRQTCERCCAGKPPYPPSADTAEWVQHKLTDPSWVEWRDAYPAKVEALLSQ